MVSPQELGERLRQAREACGLTQAQVAAELGLPRPSVGEIEAGRRGVGVLELDRLAFLLGREMGDFMRSSFEAGEDPLAAMFRAAPELAQGERAHALRRAVRLSHELAGLEELLAIPRAEPSPLELPRPPRRRWDSVQQGERAADQERRHRDLGSAPLADLPALVAAAGARAFSMKMPDDISGCTLRIANAGVLVVVNGRHSHLRQRFSWAHELAHVRLDVGAGSQVSRTSAHEDLREVRANAFAAALLMPAEGVRELVERLGKGLPSRSRVQVYDGAGAIEVEGRVAAGSQRLQLYDVLAVARHFGVSRQAAAYRLRSLGLLDSSDLATLLDQDARGLARRLEAALWPADPSEADRPASAVDGAEGRLLSLALDAYRQELISQGRFIEHARLVGIDRDRALALLEDAGLLDAAPIPTVVLAG